MSDEISIESVNALIKRNQLSMIRAAATVSLASNVLLQKCGRRDGAKNIRRKRKPVEKIHYENWSCSVQPDVSNELYLILEITQTNIQKIDYIKKCKRQGNNLNGDILNSQQLSMALWWIAGGDKYNIDLNHGVFPDEVMASVWATVDEVNSCK